MRHDAIPPKPNETKPNGKRQVGYDSKSGFANDAVGSPSNHAVTDHYAEGAAAMIAVKSSTFKLAPPTNAPSMFG